MAVLYKLDHSPRIYTNTIGIDPLWNSPVLGGRE